MSLLSFTPKGIYCEQADIFIDPWKAVNKALITHGHADHARWGHKSYLTQHDNGVILQQRLGKGIPLQTVSYGERIPINGVTFSFHPAGHVIGSSQIRVDDGKEVWVVSGDYKTEDDGISRAFEPVSCDVFISESTFGLPVFRWKPQAEVFAEINAWWADNASKGVCSILSAYSLGKAQRIMTGLNADIGPVYLHGSVHQMNEVIEAANLYKFTPSKPVTKDTSKAEFRKAIVICPPAALNTNWIKKFAPYETASASGWMMLRGTRRMNAVDKGFVLSDHADWPGLNQAIQDTGARKVIVTHGYTAQFSKWLNDQGYEALVEQTEFEGEGVSKEEQEEIVPENS